MDGNNVEHLGDATRNKWDGMIMRTTGRRESLAVFKN
jgi:hypothetical protein